MDQSDRFQKDLKAAGLRQAGRQHCHSARNLRANYQRRTAATTTMSLWVDQFRPTSLDKLDYHPELTSQLQKLASTGDLPHLLVYGPSGAGKKTRINAMLRDIYGAGVEKVKMDNKQFEVRHLLLMFLY